MVGKLWTNIQLNFVVILELTTHEGLLWGFVRFQWYCMFYRGRRCNDDARQISRWLKSAGPKGRFRSQLCNKILAAKTTCNDTSISPVIRQTLLHWGLEIKEDVLAKHKKRVGA